MLACAIHTRDRSRTRTARLAGQLKWMLLLFGSVAAATAVSGCSKTDHGDAEIRHASIVTETEVSLLVPTCNATLTVDVEETESEVRVAVSYTDDSVGDDCADGVVVQLDRPLGDRRLYDKVGERFVSVEGATNG